MVQWMVEILQVLTSYLFLTIKPKGILASDYKIDDVQTCWLWLEETNFGSTDLKETKLLQFNKNRTFHLEPSTYG